MTLLAISSRIIIVFSLTHYKALRERQAGTGCSLFFGAEFKTLGVSEPVTLLSKLLQNYAPILCSKIIFTPPHNWHRGNAGKMDEENTFQL